MSEYKEESLRNVEILAGRIARLYYWTAKTLIDECGEEEAERLLKKIVADYGVETGEMAREAVIKEGFEPTIDNYSKGRDLPSEGWRSEVQEATPESLVTHIYHCPLAAVWQERYEGFEKWAKIYCAIDAAKYCAYDTSCDCTCEKNMLDKEPYCLVKVFKKK